MSQRFIKPISVKDVLGVIGYNNPTPSAVAPLRFTNNGNTDIVIQFERDNVTDVETMNPSVGVWTSWDSGDITLLQGGAICIRAKHTQTAPTTPAPVGKFKFVGGAGDNHIDASGSVMSMIYGAELNSENNKIIPYPYAFLSLFANCDSLKTAPELPATTLADGSYSSMFLNTNISAAPELPAANPASYAYIDMFQGCALLMSASVAFIDWNVLQNMTSGWMIGVAPNGVFRCPAELDTSIRDDSHIPAGWTIETY